MPVHDWTRVDAGVFHDFHSVWIGQLRNSLNEGLLPSGYYAMAEQHAGRYIADVLTLHAPAASESPQGRTPGGLTVMDAPPKMRLKFSLSPAATSRRKTLAIRHVSGHRLVAIVEIVSPGNKDRRDRVDDLLDKLEDALSHQVNVLLVDLFPSGPFDPKRIHGALWDRLGDAPDNLPKAEPLTLAAYVAEPPIKAYVEVLAVGQPMPDMPLFLDSEYYVNVPLEATYQATWRGTPEHWRRALENGRS